MLSKEYQKKAQLNIIGNGSNLKLLKTLANNNQHIIFHGKIKRDYMAQYYKSSDFLIVSLIDEPIFTVTVPAKIQTYIAAKKPILAVINGDASDIVRENNLGLCVDPSDVILIKEALQKCINMPDSEKESFINHSDIILQTVFNKGLIMNDMTNILVK